MAENSSTGATVSTLAARPSLTALITAFAVLYVVWGSTYLAMAIGVETLPPLLMAAARFLIAGLLLLAWQRLRSTAVPTLRMWGSAAITGVLLFVGGNGVVMWALQWVPSSVAALLIASVPLWMAVLPWLVRRAPAPGPLVLLGIAVGLAGVATLVGVPSLHHDHGHDRTGTAVFLGTLAILASTVSWASGSLLMKALPLPPSPFQAAGMQMIAGGAALLLLGSALGEWRLFHPQTVSTASLWALGYLIVFGAMIGFGAFGFLIKHCSATAVGTHAFVNPVVAVALGWWWRAEPIGPRVLSAGALVVIAVALIVFATPRATTPT